jgi:apolipoprotein N-acyltransferase
MQAVLPALLLLSALGVEAAGRARLAAASDGVVEGVRLRIVQPAVPQTLKWDQAEARRIYALLLAMTRGEAEGAGRETPTLVVWPESAVPFLLEESADGLAQLADATPVGAHLLIGALRRTVEADAGTGQRKVFNSILTIGPGAAVLNRYDKWQLVPFGEYLPFESVLEPLGLRRIVQVPGGLSAGPGPRIVSIEGVPTLVPLVCYEGIFPEAAQPEGERPAFLLNVTNDAWFGDSAGPHQHLEQARMRAIEQGLPLIRAANTGISAVVDAYGRMRAEAALGTRTVIDAPLPIVTGVTTYARYREAMFILLCVALIAVVALYSRR